MTEPEDIKRLRSRFPCCDRVCTHDLEIEVPRDVACPGCGMVWTATMIPAHQHVQTMAGRRVVRVILERRTDVPTP
jgi:hypothetical protein